MNELGDIRQLIDEVDEGKSASPRSEATANVDAYLVNRVRPKPAFVVGVVVAAIVAAVGLLLAALGAIGLLPLPIGVIIGLAGLTASGVAWIVGDSLTHETSTNYPMSSTRASGYYLASFLAVYGLAFAGLVVLGALAVWAVVLAALGVVAAVVLVTFLGATQTIRKKPWARAVARQYAANDRFTRDPVAAARFGIYTAVIWILAFAAFIVLSATTGFAWSWLVFPLGFAVFMIVLARMLFPADAKDLREGRMNN